MERRIFVFWTGDNEMSENRKQCLTDLKNVTECEIILITKDNLNEWILEDYPLHKSYPYLSFVHRSDYLRCYFMYHYGGGYSDIKTPLCSWLPAFEYMDTHPDIWMCGFRELPMGTVEKVGKSIRKRMLGMSAFIMKKDTPIVNEWYETLNSVLDEKYEALKLHPAVNPRDCNEFNTDYPIKWAEILGCILQKIEIKYLDNLYAGITMKFTDYL